MDFENKGFKTMGSKTVFGNAIADWFEALLAGTLTEHTHTSQDVKAGIFTVDQQDFVSFSGGPAALGREIQRLGG